MTNIAMNPTAKCRAVVPRMSPPHRVAIQLKILTPVGTAISMVVAANTESAIGPDRKSTRLNSSHGYISYAVFCLKKKKKKKKKSKSKERNDENKSNTTAGCRLQWM